MVNYVTHIHFKGIPWLQKKKKYRKKKQERAAAKN